MPLNSEVRYRYTIEQAQPLESTEPYKTIKDVYTREEAKQECPRGGNCVPYVTKERQVRRVEPGFGTYLVWECISSGSLWLDELHSDKPIDDFLYSAD